MGNKKSPRGIRPRRYSPFPQDPKFVTVTQDTSLRGKAEVCEEDLFGRAKTGGLGQVTTKKIIMKTRKAPGALDPAVVLPPPPGDVTYVTVTQDKSPCLCSERHDEYLFGRAKTGGLGQVTTKKKNHGKKRVLLDPVLTAG